jgi:PAP2 superfamily C-terminal
MASETNSIMSAWSKALASRSFRNQFFLTLLVFAAVCMHNFHYLRIWQSREGVQINDMLLNQLPPHNFSPEIFLMEYCTLLLVIFVTLHFPERFVKGLQMFALIMFARTISIYFFPLEPPRDMIRLDDPFAAFFLHSKDTFVTKDLFFSGHISALTLLMLISVNKYIKAWALIATVVVGSLILCQHVHYTLDVVFAPFFSFVCYKIILFIHRESRYGIEMQGQEQSV